MVSIVYLELGRKYELDWTISSTHSFRCTREGEHVLWCGYRSLSLDDHSVITAVSSIIEEKGVYKIVISLLVYLCCKSSPRFSISGFFICEPANA